MATEAPAQTEQTPATAPANAGGNESSSQPTQVDLAEASLEQLDTLFDTGALAIPAAESSGDGGKEKGSATPVETPAAQVTPESTETPVETEEAPAGESTPAATEETPETPEEEKGEVERIQRPRLKDPIDQQIAAVFKAAEVSGDKITWAEAERRVKGDSKETPTPPAATPQKPAVSQAVDALRGEVETLESQLDEKAGEEGVLYDKAIKDLQSQLSDKKIELKLAERDLATQQDAFRQSRVEARQQSTARALQAFPDIANESTPLGKAVAARIAKLKASDSPVLYDDNAPYYVARDVAEELGVAPATKKTATPPTVTTVTPAAARKPVVSPPSGARTSAPASPVNPQAEQAKSVEYLKKEATLEELDNLYMPGGTDSLLYAVAGR